MKQRKREPEDASTKKKVNDKERKKALDFFEIIIICYCKMYTCMYIM